MKYIIATLILTTTICSSYSQCSVGGNGLAVSSNITIDGNVSDWNAVLSDPDNYTFDATPDMDAPITDVGRDFTRFAFTETSSNLFLYFGRAGSANNSVDALLYLDVNNNGLMETNEPVAAISWSGANGNGKVDIYNYIQNTAGGDAITGDGVNMPGSLSSRTSLGIIGHGTVDGLALEVAIPFSQIYKQGSSNTADKLIANKQFKYHVSTINGSPGSVPGAKSINDNFNGCYSGLMILPVKMEYFESKEKGGDFELTWKVSDNEHASKFEIQVSEDGKNFSTIGAVFASQENGKHAYSYTTDNKKGSYFRLKIIDTDGAYEFSKIIRTNNDLSAKLDVKFNNIVHSNLNVNVDATEAITTLVKIFNVAGMQTFSQTITLQPGTNQLSIPSSGFMTAGQYVLHISTASSKSAVVQKLLKI
ncbi:MAG TPA: hypothetical protein VM101_02030 [Flavitalea sp.]|nr:hypothetical protein [Flavitalea sp.]